MKTPSILIGSLLIAASCAAAAAAAQPNPNNVAINAKRIAQAQGKRFSLNENRALTSVAGVTPTINGTPTIQGMPPGDVRYRYDGVPFTPPTGGNASGGLMNGIATIQFGPP